MKCVQFSPFLLPLTLFSSRSCKSKVPSDWLGRRTAMLCSMGVIAASIMDSWREPPSERPRVRLPTPFDAILLKLLLFPGPSVTDNALGCGLVADESTSGTASVVMGGDWASWLRDNARGKASSARVDSLGIGLLIERDNALRMLT